MAPGPASVDSGLSRRALLRLCLAAAALLALTPALAPVMAEVLAARRRRPLIWLSFQACTGCTESLSRAHRFDFTDEQLADLEAYLATLGEPR
jgi:hydrogenase small subunit